MATEQRREDRDSGVVGRRNVGNEQSGHMRWVRREQAGVSLVVDVVCRAVDVRSRLTVSADRAVHDGRIAD
jgi:hypothetical protein